MCTEPMNGKTVLRPTIDVKENLMWVVAVSESKESTYCIFVSLRRITLQKNRGRGKRQVRLRRIFHHHHHQSPSPTSLLLPYPLLFSSRGRVYRCESYRCWESGVWWWLNLLVNNWVNCFVTLRLLGRLSRRIDESLTLILGNQTLSPGQ